MADIIFGALDICNTYIWYVAIFLLVASALYFTFKTRFIQLRIPGGIMRVFASREGRDKSQSIGAFQAFATSLAGRVGTGNIAGVASAIFVGGPGSVFWMWVMAFFGAATAFAESTLAQLYKRKGKDSFYGGPSYYMLHGLKCRWMGVVFAILMVFTMGTANQFVQSNTLSLSLSEFSGISTTWIGLILMVVTLAVIFGGVQRIAKFSAVVVPIMAVGYISISLAVIVVNYDLIPSVFGEIIDNAFGLREVGGGAVGIAISQGIRRGLFSNEAGEGTTPNSAATADISHPVKQGILQSIGVFVDTLLICSCTAFIILISGQNESGLDGILLTKSAMDTLVGNWGNNFLTLAVLFFAFSTIIANYLYSEINIRFLTQKKWPVVLMKVATGAFIIIGSLLDLQDIWIIVDFFQGTMTLFSLAALLLLSPKVFFLLRDYMAKLKTGADPTFHRSEMPDTEKDLDAWDD